MSLPHIVHHFFDGPAHGAGMKLQPIGEVKITHFDLPASPLTADLFEEAGLIVHSLGLYWAARGDKESPETA